MRLINVWCVLALYFRGKAFDRRILFLLEDSLFTLLFTLDVLRFEIYFYSSVFSQEGD